MKRRAFLIAGSLGVLSQVCAGWTRYDQADSTAQLPTPTEIPLPTETATVTPTATAEPTSTPTATAAPTATPTPLAAQNLVDDHFPGPTGDLIRVDSAGQITFSDEGMLIEGTAPAQNDPSIYARQTILPVEGQVVGVRIKIAPYKECGRVGLATPEGEAIATLRRTAAEGEGGIIECGARAFPVLNLYSGCWYDLVVFLQPERVAVAVNDGAGLELVLISEDGGSGPGSLGYWAEAGAEQGASVAGWYAVGPGYFPPLLAAEPAPAPDFEADTGDNAVWVEARISRVDGHAGLRIRSVDRENEYRVYLDGQDIQVDQVIDGAVTPWYSHAVTYRAGAKLAVRYNELTLAVYFDDAPCGITNQKIGAPPLLAGTKVGVYSTHADNEIRDLSARPVRLAVPAVLDSRLIHARQVLCLGDSLTSADKAFGYQNRLRKSLGDGWVTVDAGVSGQSTWQMFSRLAGHLSRYQPERLVVLGGTNDINRGADAGMVKANLQAIYAAGRQAGCKVTAITIPPMGSWRGWTEEKQAVLRNVNGWIVGGAGQVDARIDLYSKLEDPGTGRLLPGFDGGDGLHLSPDAYNILADNVLFSGSW